MKQTAQIDYGCAPAYSGQVFLGQTLVLSAFLDHFAHFQWHALVVELLRLVVQFGCVFCHQMLLILPRRPCDWHTMKSE